MPTTMTESMAQLMNGLFDQPGPRPRCRTTVMARTLALRVAVELALCISASLRSVYLSWMLSWGLDLSLPMSAMAGVFLVLALYSSSVLIRPSRELTGGWKDTSK